MVMVKVTEIKQYTEPAYEESFLCLPSVILLLREESVSHNSIL